MACLFGNHSRLQFDSAKRIPDPVESNVVEILDIGRGEFPDALIDKNHGGAQVDDPAPRKLTATRCLP